MTPDNIDRLNAALSGRYHVERKLGEGGMATVYLADDQKHRRKVALKVLRPELAAVVGPDRFLAEIEVTANLQHPHILPLFDSGSAGGSLFFVMPFVEGETLRDRLDREKQLPVDEAVAIARAVAGALAAAHELGVIHRDIKPGNVLLSRGEPLVADFGISLAVSKSGGGRLTETGLSVGTPYYMSPEQATGDRDITAASDVYSLGCVLYEMLVGEPPHMGSTAQAVLGKIVTEIPRTPSRVRATVPRNVDAAVMRSLEKVPADRFAKAADFARALSDPGFRHGAVADVSSHVRPRGRLATASLAAGVAILLATTIWGWLRPPYPAPIVRFEFTLPEGVALDINNGVNFALSSDGSRVVFRGIAGGTLDGQLWHRVLDQIDPTPIPGTQGARNPRFSPDARAVAFTGAGRLTRVSLEGAPAVTLVPDGVPDGGGGIAWSDDGWIYYRRFNLGIWRVPEDSGEPEEVTTLTAPEGGHVWVEALPGGRGILFTRDLGGTDEDAIAVHDLLTGETRTLAQGAMARYAHSGHLVYASGEGSLLAAPFDLDRLEITGPTRTLLAGVQVNNGSASYFAMSESGVLLYQRGLSGGRGRPTWIARDGSEEVIDSAWVGLFESPSISPDGSKVALTNIDGQLVDVWVYDLAQGSPTRLTLEGLNSDPFWSGDGREIGFTSNRGGSYALYAQPADLSAGARPLLADPGNDLWDGEWTPDRARLVYARGPDNYYDIYHVSTSPDSTPRPFAATVYEEDSPALSPDGRWLAYVSSESGQNEVYVGPFPGPGGRTTISSNGGNEPVWASDLELVYVATSGGGTFVAATLSVNTAGAVAVARRTEIAPVSPFLGGGSDHPRYDVSPVDGRLFAVRSLLEPATTSQPVLVLNWFQELEAAFGNQP